MSEKESTGTEAKSSASSGKAAASKAGAATVPPVPHVLQAISSVAATMAMTGISKDRENKQQGFKFRGIDDVLNALSGVLSANKLLIVPRMLKRTQTERTTGKGAALFSVVVDAEFDFTSVVDGSIVTVRMFGEAMDSGDKATNKAMSAAYKYAAFQTFCIPTEGDNDADATTHPEVIARISADQAKAIKDLAAKAGVEMKAICDKAHIAAIEELHPDGFEPIVKKLNKTIEKNAQGGAQGAENGNAPQ